MIKLKDLYSNILSGLHTELPDLTMGKKLIVNVAPTGAFTNRLQNPKQPYTMAENVKAAVDACKAGAAVWHCHAREADGIPSKDPVAVKETIERVLDQCPDIVTSVIAYADYDKQGVEQIRPTVELLCKAGPTYMQTSPLVIKTTSLNEKYTYVINQEILSEVTRFLEDHGVRPEFQSDCYTSQRNVEEWLIKTGISRTPAIINIMAGFHGYGFASPANEDPWKFMYLASILQSLPKGAVHGVCAGGRNWMPLTAFAIMCGVDMVRVGMEDCVYVHPHEDDMLQTSAEAVKMVVDFARLCGREIATPGEAREILGVRPIAHSGDREKAANL